jgi:hypothetical protein
MPPYEQAHRACEALRRLEAKERPLREARERQRLASLPWHERFREQHKPLVSIVSSFAYVVLCLGLGALPWLAFLLLFGAFG